MYEKIVIASDLSEATKQVINCVQDLKKFGTNEVVLFHALGVKNLYPFQDYMMKFAEPLLIEEENLLKQLGFSVKVAIGTNGVVWELRKIVEEAKASLVVIGTHGRGMAFDALLGGEANKIMHAATFPLLIIRFNWQKARIAEMCD
jgi:nucleotide-binding universal stress UspA family protein